MSTFWDEIIFFQDTGRHSLVFFNGLFWKWWRKFLAKLFINLHQEVILTMKFHYFFQNGFFVSLQSSKQQADKQYSRGPNLRHVGTWFLLIFPPNLNILWMKMINWNWNIIFHWKPFKFQSFLKKNIDFHKCNKFSLG